MATGNHTEFGFILGTAARLISVLHPRGFFISQQLLAGVELPHHTSRARLPSSSTRRCWQPPRAQRQWWCPASSAEMAAAAQRQHRLGRLGLLLLLLAVLLLLEPASSAKKKKQKKKKYKVVRHKDGPLVNPSMIARCSACRAVASDLSERLDPFQTKSISEIKMMEVIEVRNRHACCAPFPVRSCF